MGRGDKQDPDFRDPLFGQGKTGNRQATKSITKKLSDMSKHEIVYLKYIQYLFVNYAPKKWGGGGRKRK